MSKLITVNLNKKPCYDVLIEKTFRALSGKINELNIEGKKCLIVTDSNVGPIYSEKVSKAVSENFDTVLCHEITAGEQSKNMNTVLDIMKVLTENKFGRKDILIALGGGVIGDITGFAASIYMRGIDFIQIPTSLLAMVDSSIGGKTGVDFDGIKNIVGAFKMPRLVYVNISVLKTLSGRQYFAGLAEVMKYGLLCDANFYTWLIDNMYEVHDQDLPTMETMIETCISHKQRIVEKDPFENGDRALLNLGHTIGHAIEAYKNFELLHGECVALGCVCAAYISWKKEKLTSDEYYEIRDMFVPFHLPITVENIDPAKIIDIVKNDKKSINGSIKFILLKKVGKAYIDMTVTDEEMLASINEIYFDEDDMKA